MSYLYPLPFAVPGSIAATHATPHNVRSSLMGIPPIAIISTSGLIRNTQTADKSN